MIPTGMVVYCVTWIMGKGSFCPVCSLLFSKVWVDIEKKRASLWAGFLLRAKFITICLGFAHLARDVCFLLLAEENGETVRTCFLTPFHSVSTDPSSCQGLVPTIPCQEEDPSLLKDHHCHILSLATFLHLSHPTCSFYFDLLFSSKLLQVVSPASFISTSAACEVLVRVWVIRVKI